MRLIAMLPLIIICAVSTAAAAPAQVSGGGNPARVSKPRPIQSDVAMPDSLLQASTYRLWNRRAPGATSDSPSETPTLSWFPPQLASNGTAIIIAPGGGYVDLAGVLEGTEPAAWFTMRGVTAFVLQYRVGRDALLPTPLLDGARAVRFVRAHASDFHIDPNRIGMMGFSAGGHLAAMTAVQATPGNTDATDPVERVSSQPDFIILAYPWLEATQVMPNGHSAYCDLVIQQAHTDCDPQRYTRYLPLSYVTPKAPPTFFYLTTDDDQVTPEGSLRLYEALWKQRVSVEMHIFSHGHHASVFGGTDQSLSLWPQLLQEWMRHSGLLPAAPVP
jgi:acetyl esterase/lipase